MPVAMAPTDTAVSADPVMAREPMPAAQAIPRKAEVPTASKPAAATQKSAHAATPKQSAESPSAETSAPVSPLPVPPAESPLPEAPASDPVPVVSRLPDPPRPVLQDLTVNQDSVIGIRLDTTVSSETARVEDKVTATVARDVNVAGRTAIPSGSKLEGNVVSVEHGGKFKERSRLGIRFRSLLLADGTRISLQTETIFREGESPTGQATSKVGASAIVGGILGAVIGGGKGAAIGSTVGAAGGTAAVMAGGPKEAVFQAGTPLTLRLTQPVTVTVEKQQNVN
jgi:hypothetical protein